MINNTRAVVHLTKALAVGLEREGYLVGPSSFSDTTDECVQVWFKVRDNGKLFRVTIERIPGLDERT